MKSSAVIFIRKLYFFFHESTFSIVSMFMFATRSIDNYQLDIVKGLYQRFIWLCKIRVYNSINLYCWLTSTPMMDDIRCKNNAVHWFIIIYTRDQFSISTWRLRQILLLKVIYGLWVCKNTYVIFWRMYNKKRFYFVICEVTFSGTTITRLHCKSTV